jgi:hypothetical protein
MLPPPAPPSGASPPAWRGYGGGRLSRHHLASSLESRQAARNVSPSAQILGAIRRTVNNVLRRTSRYWGCYRSRLDRYASFCDHFEPVITYHGTSSPAACRVGE